MIFGYSEAQLETMKARHTAAEIYQQPAMWQKTWAMVAAREPEIRAFLDANLTPSTRVVLTGAGSAAYAGDVARAYLAGLLSCRVESISTTDMVEAPQPVLEDVPTLLVSFARSGNSPESVGAFNLMEAHTKNIAHLIITCAAGGQLARKAGKNPKNLVLLLPPEVNDRGLTMIGSFSCMLLTVLLVFDPAQLAQNKDRVTGLAAQGQEILDHRWKWVRELTQLAADRIVYLGVGCFQELGKELSLKGMDLTNGRIVSIKESVLGFRHGPKTIVNDHTLILLMGSSTEYANRYVRDIAAELYGNPGSQKLAILGCLPDDKLIKTCHYHSFVDGRGLPEAYTCLLYAIYGQMLALFNSIAVGNTPDNPNPAGVVNRVVKGVTIYSY